MALKTDYKDDVYSGERKYTISGTGANQTIEETTAFTQEGDTFGANDINATNKAIMASQSHITASVTFTGTAPSTATVTLQSGYRFNENAVVRIAPNTTGALTDKLLVKNFSMITKATADTSTNVLTLVCGAKVPANAVSIKIFGVEAVE